MKPQVSVIIPLYNGEKTIGKAMQSVATQSLFKQIELVIVDDGSKDNGLAKARKIAKTLPLTVRFYKNAQNQGIAKTQNKGLKNATGKYIARLDQDDLWIDKDKIKKQVALLEKNKGVGLVGTWTKVKNHNGPDFVLTPPKNDREIRQKILFADLFAAPSVLFRRDLIKRIGRYREDLCFGTEDYEYWLRIGTVAKFAILPQFTLEYHFHAKSYSSQNKVAGMREHLKIIKQYQSHYPNYRRALIKNTIQLNILKIRWLEKFYGLIAPRLAGRVYS